MNIIKNIRNIVKNFSTNPNLLTQGGATTPAQAQDILFNNFDLYLNDNITLLEAYKYVAPVKTSVDKIVDNINKAKLRCYKNDKEMTNSNLLSIFDKNSDLVSKLLLNYLIYSEFVLEIIYGPNGDPIDLQSIESPSITPANPVNPKEINEVIQWQITDQNGVPRKVPAASIIFYRKPSPTGEFRGVSQLHSIENEINIYYRLGAYAADFFNNGAMPSYVLNFKNNITKPQKDEIETMLDSKFKWSDRKSGKALIIGGNEVSIESLAQGFDKINIKDIQSYIASVIYAKFGIPALVAGQFGQTRFNSANEELYSFTMNTLQPIVEEINAYFRIVVNKLPNSFVSKGLEKELTQKQLKRLNNKLNKLNKINIETQNKGITLLIDDDTLPGVLESKASSFDIGIKLMQNYNMSVNEVNEYLDLDLPYDPINDLKPSDMAQKSLKKNIEVKEEVQEIDNIDYKKLTKFINCDLRKIILSKDNNVSISILDNLNKDNDLEVKELIRCIFDDIKRLKNENNIDDLKQYLNKISKKKTLKKIIGENNE